MHSFFIITKPIYTLISHPPLQKMQEEIVRLFDLYPDVEDNMRKRAIISKQKLDLVKKAILNSPTSSSMQSIKKQSFVSSSIISKFLKKRSRQNMGSTAELTEGDFNFAF